MDEENERKSFVIYMNWATIIANLPTELAGELAKAICSWELDEEPEINDPTLNAIFLSFLPMLKKDRKKYEKKVANAEKTNRKRNAKTQKRNANNEERDASVTQNEESVGVNDNDNVNVNVNDSYINYQKIVDKYNETCVSFPQVRSLSEDRKKAIRARLRTYSPDDLFQAFWKAEQSDFLKGANDRNWSANFDWIMKDRNIAKILDGNYDNRSRPSGSYGTDMDNLRGSMRRFKEMEAGL